MEQAVEWFIAITALIVGLSHCLRPADWVTVFRQLHALGRPGAFVSGGLNLVPGAAIVAGHPSWAWPGAILTGFEWLLVLKGFVSFLAPDKALRSMDREGRSASEFIFAGVLLLVIGAWAYYCIWSRSVHA